MELLTAITRFRLVLFLLAFAFFFSKLARTLFFPLPFLILGQSFRFLSVCFFFSFLAVFLLGFLTRFLFRYQAF